MTNDWTRQTEEMIRTWTGAQQRMFESWLGAMQGKGSLSASDSWQHSLDAWRSGVQQALDAQVKWAQSWSDAMSSTGGSGAQMGEVARQGMELMRRWTEAQSQLWNRWFDLARQANPEAFTSMMNNDEAQRVIRSWQEASQQAVNAQMEWMRMFAQQGQAMQEQMTQPTDVNQQHGQGQ
jgi:hypothetical protein